MKDTWRKTTFFSTYTYHHGYFDVIEREFTKCCETKLPVGVVLRFDCRREDYRIVCHFAVPPVAQDSK